MTAVDEETTGGVLVAVCRERADGERRVALTPDEVTRLGEKGARVRLERGAGTPAGFADESYALAGAELVADAAAALAGADAVLRVAPPDEGEIAALPEGVLVISYLRPLDRPEIAQQLAARGVSALAVELVPRITRAQTMDALSSQASVAGYRAVLVAATHLPRYFPLLMTAAGTVPPAKVLVLGAGVAGLQAIATARRLGAVVSAFDVRPVVREQVESLGATFLEVELPEAGEASGGYAQELSEETQRLQRELLAEHIAGSDVVITTALVPGQAGAAADRGRHGRVDAAGLRDRRPRRRGRRQLRADRAGRDRRARERHDRRRPQPGRRDALRREPPLRAQRHRVARRVPAGGPHRDRRGRRRDRRLPRLPPRRRRPSRRPGAPAVNSQLIHELTVLALAVFVGFEVISKVPTMLHTPLMSGTNAIHGIVIVGAILVAGAGGSGLATILGLIAVAFGAINVVGGFVVTDRMLQMFRRKDET